MNVSFKQTQQSQREEIVDKLHGALASLRKERDQLYRSKELAVERLRLTKEERETVEKKVRSMEDTYARLTEGSKDNRLHHDDEDTKLQKEVERLGKEVRS